jgi:uncharacterized protein YbjT (DUF2867 family)
MSRVAVLGASGRMGQAQVRQLLAQNLLPIAVTRNRAIFDQDAFDGAEVAAADYDDPPSIYAVLKRADIVFFQPPSMSDPTHVWRQCETVRDAAIRAGVQRFILNSAMWAPDEPPCGEPLYDHVRRVEDLFMSGGLSVTAFRPVLFMDNLLTIFAKPALVGEGVYRYCHRPGLRATWISMDDVARFMIAAIDRDDLINRRITIGGPETLPIEAVLEILSDVLGRNIRHEYVEPRAFGESAHAAMGGALSVDREAYGAFFDSFYTFNNYSPLRPFEVDMKPVLESIPLSLTTLREWAYQQDWTSPNTVASVASVAG